MTGTEAIQAALKSTQHMLGWFLEDLSDSDLLVRPAQGANHIAWQLGHLINAEKFHIQQQLPGAEYPDLPPDFPTTYTADRATADGPHGFHTKSEYLSLFNAVRNATIKAVGKLTDADLDRPSNGGVAAFAPTLGDVLVMISNHTLMHGGQFTIVRRKLGKPVLF
jgi:hypothetical protein